MFDFEVSDTNKENQSANLASPPITLNQQEIAEIIRIAEDHSLSRAAQVKLLLLARDHKRRIHTKSE